MFYINIEENRFYNLWITKEIVRKQSNINGLKSRSQTLYTTEKKTGQTVDIYPRLILHEAHVFPEIYFMLTCHK